MADTLRFGCPTVSLCSPSSSTRGYKCQPCVSVRAPKTVRMYRPRSVVVRAAFREVGSSSVGPNCKLVYTKHCEDDDENCKVEVEEIQETQTDFIAETLLPTHGGQFRVRAYRHW
eukprot:6383129-Pyramimonas_sp.AAC.1